MMIINEEVSKDFLQYEQDLITIDGFDSFQDFWNLLLKVKKDSTEKNERYENWLYKDGSKKGLLKLIEENSK